MNIRSYRDLQVWQRSIELGLRCYRESQSFPREERYGLTSQLRRAAVSVPANIAEGRGRARTGEFARAISIASGSLAEVETLLVVAERLNYITREIRDELLSEASEIGRMLHGLRRAVLSRPRP